MTTTSADTLALLDSRTADYAAVLTNAPRNRMYPHQIDNDFVVLPVKNGQRWQKIISRRNGIVDSSWGWIDRTNGMLAYGNWKAPSKNRSGVPYYRCNLLDDAAYATLMVRTITGDYEWLYEDEITKVSL